jgi:hypothetical protein
MADEDDLDLVVVPLQEQIQQDEEALGQVLAHLIHGSGHVHDAEHHGLAGGLRLLGEGLIAQIEGVDERQRGDARLEPVDLLAQRDDAGSVSKHAGARAAPISSPVRGCARDGAPSAVRRAMAPLSERTTSMLLGAPTRGVAGADALELGGAHELVAHQIRQFQVVEQQVEELFARQLEDEVVLALAALAAGPVRSRRRRPLRALHPVTGLELLVAGMDMSRVPPDHGGTPARRCPWTGYRPFAAVDVGDAAPVDGIGHGPLELRLVALQEALPIDGALVLGVDATVDEMGHKGLFVALVALRFSGLESRELGCRSDISRQGPEGAGRNRQPGTTRHRPRSALDMLYCDLRTRRYHSDSSRTCFGV